MNKQKPKMEKVMKMCVRRHISERAAFDDEYGTRPAVMNDKTRRRLLS